MGERYLTMAEIKAAYPDEWVLIDRPKTIRGTEVLGGYVIGHSANQDDLDAVLAGRPQPFHVASRYTGSLDDAAEVDEIEEVMTGYLEADYIEEEPCPSPDSIPKAD